VILTTRHLYDFHPDTGGLFKAFKDLRFLNNSLAFVAQSSIQAKAPTIYDSTLWTPSEGMIRAAAYSINFLWFDSFQKRGLLHYLNRTGRLNFIWGLLEKRMTKFGVLVGAPREAMKLFAIWGACETEGLITTANDLLHLMLLQRCHQLRQWVPNHSSPIFKR
jgi:hypothetical protein